MIQSSTTNKQSNMLINLENLQAPKPKRKPKRSVSKTKLSAGGSGGSAVKTKKSKNISPVGKTQSTEGTNGGTGGSNHLSSNGAKNSNNIINETGQVLKVIKTGSSVKKEKPSKSSHKKRKNSKDQQQPFMLPQEKNQNNLNLLGRKYRIQDDMLGFGSFGRTYLGENIRKKKKVAIKIMIRKKSEDSFYREATVLKSVNYLKHSGFPKMLMSAMNEDICILVEELLGMNLETLRKKFGKLSLAVVCSIGIQLINRLRDLHQSGFIHRDIKPQNVLLGGDGPESSNKIYLIDFGLSIYYLDNETSIHYKENLNHNYSNVVGTALFASINAHNGKDLSRRDDIESLIYTLIYLCTGTLPWKNINIKKKRERHQIIMYMKEEVSQNPQFQQQNMENVPPEFFCMLAHSQKLSFEEEPDYKYLKTQLQKILRKNYGIKKMSDIEILKNNNEDFRHLKQPISNQTTKDSSMMPNPSYPNNCNSNINQLECQQQMQSQENILIDINSIAFNFGVAKMGGQDQSSGILNSVQSNEQLVFRSEVDGRSNNEQDIQNKLNISMFKNLFAAQSLEDINRLPQTQNGPNAGRFIDEIPEVEEDDSYGDEDDDDDGDEEEDPDSLLQDEESKNSSSLAHSNTHKSSNKQKSLKSNHSQQQYCEEESKEEQDEEEECRVEDDCDDGDDNYGCEEEIPDDLEVCAQISGYFLNAKDNDLRDIKGGLNQMNGYGNIGAGARMPMGSDMSRRFQNQRSL